MTVQRKESWVKFAALGGLYICSEVELSQHRDRRFFPARGRVQVRRLSDRGVPERKRNHLVIEWPSGNIPTKSRVIGSIRHRTLLPPRGIGSCIIVAESTLTQPLSSLAPPALETNSSNSIRMAPKSDVSRLSGTDLIHADEAFSDTNVAPSISVSTSKSMLSLLTTFSFTYNELTNIFNQFHSFQTGRRWSVGCSFGHHP